MAKIVFEFDSIEDKEEVEIYAQTLRMHAVLHDFLMELRQCTKYEKPTKRDHYWKQRLNNMLLERNVEII